MTFSKGYWNEIALGFVQLKRRLFDILLLGIPFCVRRIARMLLARLLPSPPSAGRGLIFDFYHQVNVARDVAVQMCDTLEGKAYTGVVNVSYMAVANEVGLRRHSEVFRICFMSNGRFLNDESRGLACCYCRRLHHFGGTEVDANLVGGFPSCTSLILGESPYVAVRCVCSFLNRCLRTVSLTRT